MGSTRARRSNLQGRWFSGLLSCFTILAPVIGLHFWYFFIYPSISLSILFLLPIPFSPNVAGHILLLDSMVPPALLCSLIAFAANLIIPVARNEWKAILWAIPAALYYFFLYVYPSFWLAYVGRSYPNDTPDAWTYDLLNGLESLPLWLLVFALIAWAASAGSRLGSRLETQ